MSTRQYIKALSLLLVISCAGKTIINNNIIYNDIEVTKRKIARNRKNIRSLVSKRIGKSGFYYIINKEGIVIFHPAAVLIGSNFKKYGFLKNILENRAGCYSYTFGDNRHLIFFEQITNKEILCFSISADEVDGQLPSCKKVIPGSKPLSKEKQTE